MDSVTIARLDPDRWQDFRALRLDALRTDPQAFGSSYRDARERPDTFWREWLENAARGTESLLLFAQAGCQLVGMIGAFIDAEHRYADIVAVSVLREARGQGIAKALMSALLHALEHDERITRLALDVNVDQLAAISLYASFGFGIVGSQRSVLGDGREHDKYLMEKVLT